MDPNDSPNSRVLITLWLQKLNTAQRLAHFQIIDSLVWRFVHVGVMFDARLFDFNPAYKAFAMHVAAHFRDLTTEEVLADCRSFAPLRPAEPPLPTIMSRSGNRLPAQQPIQRPSRTNLATTGGFKDHMWRGLVDDHNQALGIIWEYQAGGNKPALEIMQNYQNAHSLDANAADLELSNLRSNMAERKRYVKEMFLAMVDFTDIIDKPQKVRASKSKRKRTREEFEEEEETAADPGEKDNVQVARVKNAPDVVLESMCWVLLDATMEAQQGNVTISPWQNLDNKRFYEAYPSFRHRFDAVLESLRRSKAFIDNMMETSMVRRLAASPRENLQRKKANEKLNAKRGLSIKAGNSLVKRLKAESEASATAPVQDAEEDEMDAVAEEDMWA